MSSRRQRSIPLGGRYRQVSLFTIRLILHTMAQIQQQTRRHTFRKRDLVVQNFMRRWCWIHWLCAACALRRLKFDALWIFKQFVQANSNGKIKALYHCTGAKRCRWILLTKGQKRGKRCHIITSQVCFYQNLYLLVTINSRHLQSR